MSTPTVQPPTNTPIATNTPTPVSTPVPKISDSIGLYNPSTSTPFDLLTSLNTGSSAQTTFTQLVAFSQKTVRSSAAIVPNTSNTFIVDYTPVFTSSNPQPIGITGKWDGGDVDGLGVYDSSSGNWYLEDNDTIAFPSVPHFNFQPTNNPNARPITGDWDGSGIDKVGLYDPSTGTFYLRASNVGNDSSSPNTFVFQGANTTWLPVAGKWKLSNCATPPVVATVGLYDPTTGNWHLKCNNAAGGADLTFTFNPPDPVNPNNPNPPSCPNCQPVAGDWIGNGFDTVGLYDPNTGQWYLLNALPSNGQIVLGSSAYISVQFSMPSKYAIAGHWSATNPTPTPVPVPTPSRVQATAPNWTTAHYISSADFGVLDGDGCNDGGKNVGDALVILNFGSPVVLSGLALTYPNLVTKAQNDYGKVNTGVDLLDETVVDETAKVKVKQFKFLPTINANPTAPQQVKDIYGAVQTFLSAYWRCSGLGIDPADRSKHLTLAVGTNNGSGNTGPYSIFIYDKTPPYNDIQAHAGDWAKMIIKLESNSGTDATFAGGMDIERWGTADQTRAWVDTFARATDTDASKNIFYYDYGTCEDCNANAPIQNTALTNYSDVCDQAYTLSSTPGPQAKYCMDYWWYVAWGVRNALPMPEIYNNWANAYQWYNLSRFAATCGTAPLNSAGTPVPINPNCYPALLGKQGPIAFPGVITQRQRCDVQHAQCDTGEDDCPAEGWHELYDTLSEDSSTQPGLTQPQTKNQKPPMGWSTDIWWDPVPSQYASSVTASPTPPPNLPLPGC